MTVFASWLSQHVQARTQWIAHTRLIFIKHQLSLQYPKVDVRLSRFHLFR